ncbi:MAG: hypothetical protein Q4615_10390 [Paracoccus aminovorans]|nr:hypothetical protein [Paracoccus aminovorans]
MLHPLACPCCLEKGFKGGMGFFQLLLHGVRDADQRIKVSAPLACGRLIDCVNCQIKRCQQVPHLAELGLHVVQVIGRYHAAPPTSARASAQKA